MNEQYKQTMDAYKQPFKEQEIEQIDLPESLKNTFEINKFFNSIKNNNNKTDLKKQTNDKPLYFN